VTWRRAPLFAASVLAAEFVTSERALAESPNVEIIATGDEAATSAIQSLVRDLLRDRSVAIRWTEAPSIDPREVLSRRAADSGLVARVWVDLSDPLGARLFVANAASDRFLVRIVPTAKGDLDKKIENEAVAQIVSSSVEALLAGGTIGVTREVATRQVEGRLAPPAVAEPPPAEPPPGSSRSPLDAPSTTPRPSGPGDAAAIAGEVGAFFALRGLGTGPVVSLEPGLTATLEAPRRWPVRPILILALQYDAPHDWTAATVGVRLEGAGGSVQAGLRAALGPRVSLQASIGAGPEGIHVTPQPAASAGFRPESPFWVAAAILTTRIGVEVRLAGRLSVFSMAGCDVDTSGVQFNVNDRGKLSSDVVPWRVWPVVLLGASYALGADGGLSP
jgi:hypothetical protein